jgi:catechol 2,3-dioxygenase-like lactoylglutathione lyase family enzyme
MDQAGSFKVQQIDHVELFVPDRRAAAEWYHQVLGLAIVEEFEAWAAHPRGPLMISSDGGRTKLALFEGAPQGGRPTAGFHLVAFRVDAAGFLAFLGRLDWLDLRDDRDGPVTRGAVVDHEQAFSLYFCDPYGHRLELTTYDASDTRAAIAERDATGRAS